MPNYCIIKIRASFGHARKNSFVETRFKINTDELDLAWFNSAKIGSFGMKKLFKHEINDFLVALLLAMGSEEE